MKLEVVKEVKSMNGQQLQDILKKLRSCEPIRTGYLCVMNGKQLRQLRKRAGQDYKHIDKNSVYTWDDNKIIAVEKIGGNKL